ncbi:amidase domain-containing protein [Anaerosinus massiliensis]|uniref:amidase domain-containing protein n=1 Tax=Massilibacillus massiliensis TaxID=1806837 RepID=UPI000DA607DF|nr:amidase domain-containing protein [Massilibacillus massiliensis]
MFNWDDVKNEAKRQFFMAGHTNDYFTPVTFAFSRNDAVYYAHTYAYQQNSKYPYYNGHDCTNFVSQCWTYAGIPITEDWFYDEGVSSPSWSGVDGFANYMVNRGYARITYSSLEANLGDVIQFYHPDLGGWHHSAIITSIDEYGNLYYAAHSDSTYDKPLSNVYPESGDELRFLCPNNAY